MRIWGFLFKIVPEGNAKQKNRVGQAAREQERMSFLCVVARNQSTPTTF